MRPILHSLMAALLAVIALSHPANADPKQERAVRVVESLLSDAHSALHGGGNGTALRGAISDAFAFDVWERFLIESRADRFGPDERKAFRDSLPGFMAFLYHDQFQRGLDVPPTLGDARRVRRDVMVRSAFPRAEGPALPVDWRLREFPDRGSQVIDIMVGGTSFLYLKRDEFVAILDRDGVAGLLEYLSRNRL